MLINRSNLTTLFNGFNTSFMKGFSALTPLYPNVAMTVPSTAAQEDYGWIGQFPKMREWIGPRVINNLTAQTYSIKNRKFENTVSVGRTDIEDDRYGIFAPIMEEMGRSAREHPDDLVFSLLKTGFTSTCYDGQYFFDADHPVRDDNGNEVSVANTDGGSGPAWFLLDTSRAIKPMVYQERIPYQFTRLTADNDDNVFFNDEFIYGVRSRCNVGFGLWQLAWGSKQTLDASHYATARAALQNMKGDNGRPLGIKPDTLIVPPSLESAALKLVNSELASGGETNEWKGTAKPIVTVWVA